MSLKTVASPLLFVEAPLEEPVMNANTLYALLLEVESEDPIDYADLPFDEENLRKLACLNVVELLDSDAYSGLVDALREQVIAATITKLVLENMVLNARLRRMHPY
jgi:hypothetical protein